MLASGRGGLRGLSVRRDFRTPRCCFGQNLATRAEFDAQHERAMGCLRWYEQYVHLLRRLESGRTPLVVDLFCGAGGSSEGVRRMGGASLGVDDTEQPHFVARFGGEWFVLSDALDRERLRAKRASD